MDKFVTKRNDLLAEAGDKEFEVPSDGGTYVQTKEEALALALELIPEGSSISWGGSMSIKAIGLPEALHKGNYKVLDRDLCATPEEKQR
ncbi:MAG: LUD domain-containing protein [Coprococcus sp.]